MLLVSVLQRVVLEPRVHILIHDRLRGVQVFLPLLLLFLISSLNGQNSLSELNKVFSSVSPWSAWLFSPSIELFLSFDIPSRRSLFVSRDVSELGLLRQTITKKSDSDRVLIDIDNPIVVVVSHIPVVIHSLLDITVVFVLKDGTGITHFTELYQGLGVLVCQKRLHI